VPTGYEILETQRNGEVCDWRPPTGVTMYGCDIPRLEIFPNRIAEILSLHIFPTYSGLIEGYPDRTLNNRVLDHLVSEASRIYCLDCLVDNEAASEEKKPLRRPFLIEPKRMPSPAPISNPHRQIENLPGFTWFALLQSGSKLGQPSDTTTEMVVVWLQNSFQYCPDTAANLWNLPWDEWAWSFRAGDI